MGERREGSTYYGSILEWLFIITSLLFIIITSSLAFLRSYFSSLSFILSSSASLPYLYNYQKSPSNPESKTHTFSQTRTTRRTVAMTTYHGRCHCGQTEWTTKIDGDAHILWYVWKNHHHHHPTSNIHPLQSQTPLPSSPIIINLYLAQMEEVSMNHPADQTHTSHCNACKLLSGGENTLNQMANQGDLKITKGSTKTYTYVGDSGVSLLPFSLFYPTYLFYPLPPPILPPSFTPPTLQLPSLTPPQPQTSISLPLPPFYPSPNFHLHLHLNP